MKKIFFLFVYIFLHFTSKSQVIINDSLRQVNLDEVIISSPRTDLPLNEVPAAISIVTNEQVNTMGKSIATDEKF